MSLFGAMPFPVQFFLAFVIVLGLIGLTAWAVRRFGAGRLGGVGARGRQPRLAVVDYASVDGRRRLILVRRDNVEHLVMIGGPTDIVIEPNIVRASPAPREIAVTRPPAVPEPPPRAVALPEAAANIAWPQQPEPVPPPAAMRAPRLEPIGEEMPAVPLQPHAEPQPRAPRESLAALADELSTKSAAPPRNRPPAAARPAVVEPRAEPRPEPRIAIAQPAAGEAAAATDQSLAEMAHQLEAALRKPTAKTERAEARELRTPTAPRTATASEQPAAAQPAAAPPPAPSSPPLRAVRTPEVKAPRADVKTSPAGKTLYDSLEQEMASLLGRPTAKN